LTQARIIKTILKIKFYKGGTVAGGKALGCVGVTLQQLLNLHQQLKFP